MRKIQFVLARSALEGRTTFHQLCEMLKGVSHYPSSQFRGSRYSKLWKMALKP